MLQYNLFHRSRLFMGIPMVVELYKGGKHPHLVLDITVLDSEDLGKDFCCGRLNDNMNALAMLSIALDRATDRAGTEH